MHPTEVTRAVAMRLVHSLATYKLGRESKVARVQIAAKVSIEAEHDCARAVVAAIDHTHDHVVERCRLLVLLLHTNNRLRCIDERDHIRLARL